MSSDNTVTPPSNANPVPNEFTHIFLYRPEDQMIIIFLSNYRNRAHSGKCDAIFSILDGV